ncbi:MAG: four helix bundle protein [Candidatus Altiarchaeota archaeon]
MAQNFKNLNVYREAYALSIEVYREIKDLDRHWRLKDQLFGSTTAVCTNLAEMAAFENRNQQRQKVMVCIGECNETEFWLEFCKDACLIEEDKFGGFMKKLERIRMMLFSLKGSIEKNAVR